MVMRHRGGVNYHSIEDINPQRCETDVSMISNFKSNKRGNQTRRSSPYHKNGSHRSLHVNLKLDSSTSPRSNTKELDSPTLVIVGQPSEENELSHESNFKKIEQLANSTVNVSVKP